MNPPVRLLTRDVTVMNDVIWFGSLQSGVVSRSTMLGLHVSAQIACGGISIGLMACLRLPQTVRFLLSGSFGSGSTNVAQKSSLMPRTSRSSSSESYGAFLR